MPRKRRTREHVIADIAVNHVERFVYEAGHTCERIIHDYGYDLKLTTYDSSGYIETEQISLQVKASERLVALKGQSTFVVRVSIADVYNWIHEPMPVFLILHDVARRRSYWVYVQRYFQRNPAALAKPARSTVTIRIEARNRVNRRFIEFARTAKHNILKHQIGAVDHG
jgi:hypothetical protein